MTNRNIIDRINRRLKSRGRQLRVCPENSPWLMQLGRFYIVCQGFVCATDVDVEELADELGCAK